MAYSTPASVKPLQTSPMKRQTTCSVTSTTRHPSCPFESRRGINFYTERPRQDLSGGQKLWKKTHYWACYRQAAFHSCLLREPWAWHSLLCSWVQGRDAETRSN